MPDTEAEGPPWPGRMRNSAQAGCCRSWPRFQSGGVNLALAMPAKSALTAAPDLCHGSDAPPGGAPGAAGPAGCGQKQQHPLDLRLLPYLRDPLPQRGGSAPFHGPAQAESLAEQKPVEEQNTLLVPPPFWTEVRKRGRVFEGGLMARYLLGSGQAFGPAAIQECQAGLADVQKGPLEPIAPRH
jgi:hypothetical protein